MSLLFPRDKSQHFQGRQRRAAFPWHALPENWTPHRWHEPHERRFMSTVISNPGALAAPELTPHEDAMRRQVWSLLPGLYPTNRQCERRAEQRFPYPYLVQLTPVGADGTTKLGDPVMV